MIALLLLSDCDLLNFILLRFLAGLGRILMLNQKVLLLETPKSE